MSAFMDEYVEVYGLKKWGNSYYSACVGLINNYIKPYIGDRFVRSITTRDIDSYYTMLLETEAVVASGHMKTGAKISSHTVSRIHKLKLSRGNIKAVQGDTGHAEARMVTDTYAHGFDADRKLIAQEMDSGFFSKVGEQAKTLEVDSDTMDKLKALIQQHPELIAELLKGTEKDGIKADKTG